MTINHILIYNGTNCDGFNFVSRKIMPTSWMKLSLNVSYFQNFV